MGPDRRPDVVVLPSTPTTGPGVPVRLNTSQSPTRVASRRLHAGSLPEVGMIDSVLEDLLCVEEHSHAALPSGSALAWIRIVAP